MEKTDKEGQSEGMKEQLFLDISRFLEENGFLSREERMGIKNLIEKKRRG